MPRELQQKVLLFGITFALVLRTVFILVGAAAIENFSWVFYLFGAILIYTAWVQARSGGHGGDEDYQENAVLRFARRVLPTTEEYHSDRMTVRLDGKRFITPLAIALIAIGTRRRHLRRRLDPGDLRADPGDLPRLRRERVLAARPAPAVLPHRRAARPPRLPRLRPRGDPRLHRRQAGHPRAAHQRAAVHQRRRARHRDPRDLDRLSLAVILGTLLVTTVASLAKGRRRPAAPPPRRSTTDRAAPDPPHRPADRCRPDRGDNRGSAHLVHDRDVRGAHRPAARPTSRSSPAARTSRRSRRRPSGSAST